MAAGGRFITSAWVTLSILRDVHHCDLPIELWYLGDDDFPPDLRQRFERFAVSFIDASRAEGAEWLPRTGWELKPFALAHSRFAEVLLLDADNIPLVDPAFLFDDQRYASHGALFWHDIRRVNPYNPIWAIVGLDPPSGFEHETGQFVIDKRRHSAGLQLAEHLARYASFYYQYMLGDKESLHIAWRMLRLPFDTPSSPPEPVDGRYPGDPIDRLMAVGMWQHDLSGRRVFLHRTDLMLVAWGRNPEIPEFDLANEVDQALDELRAVWDGTFPLSTGTSVPTSDDDEPILGSFLYRRQGIEQRLMELLPEGRIGLGSDVSECFWRLDEIDGERVMTISSRTEDICALRRQSDGIWRGAWLRYEQTPVELIPVAITQTHPSIRDHDRPRLLFISPVEPKDAGNGLAMRAANMLRSLVESHRVSLLIVPLYGAGASRQMPSWVSERCEQVHWARPPSRFGARSAADGEERLRREAWVDEVARCYWGDQFDVIHVFRLAALSFASPYLDKAHHASARWHLDLDDIESRSGQRSGDSVCVARFSRRRRSNRAVGATGGIARTRDADDLGSNLRLFRSRQALPGRAIAGTPCRGRRGSEQSQPAGSSCRGTATTPVHHPVCRNARLLSQC